MKHLSDLAKRIAEMSDGQRAELAAKYPVITIERHALSIRNNCLILMQTEAPVLMVGGFRQWLNAGRCVRKGEKALWILCPMTRNAKADETPDDEGKVTFFREVAVFDVSQTDELPAQAAA